MTKYILIGGVASLVLLAQAALPNNLEQAGTYTAIAALSAAVVAQWRSGVAHDKLIADILSRMMFDRQAQAERYDELLERLNAKRDKDT